MLAPLVSVDKEALDELLNPRDRLVVTSSSESRYLSLGNSSFFLARFELKLGLAYCASVTKAGSPDGAVRTGFVIVGFLFRPLFGRIDPGLS